VALIYPEEGSGFLIALLDDLRADIDMRFEARAIVVFVEVIAQIRLAGTRPATDDDYPEGLLLCWLVSG
jgi:hypothetical protein